MKNILKLSTLLLITLILSSCDYRPSRKVIEYKEEVKLSNGEMIWVDIKRHYRLVGEPFQGKGYLPSVVEISWDTGFEGVGRKSVFFDESIDFIDKIDDVWYVVGQAYPYAGSLKGISSSNCRDIGVLINTKYQCIFRINREGEFNKDFIKAKDLGYIKMNILNIVLLNNEGNPMKQSLDKTRLSWSYKLELQNTQPKDFQLVGRPYSYHFINSSNGGEL